MEEQEHRPRTSQAGGRDVADAAALALEDKKGSAILVLDVRERSSVTNFLVLASGASTPHLKALGMSVHDTLKNQGTPSYRETGLAESGWLVLDYIDVVVHVFSEQARTYYALEALWQDAAISEQAPEQVPGSPSA